MPGEDLMGHQSDYSLLDYYMFVAFFGCFTDLREKKSVMHEKYD